MTTLTFNAITAASAVDEYDTDAMQFIVSAENKKIDDANKTTVPPLQLYPMSTDAELLTSYLSILGDRLHNIHVSYINSSVEAALAGAIPAIRAATPAQRTAAMAALKVAI